MQQKALRLLALWVVNNGLVKPPFGLIHMAHYMSFVAMVLCTLQGLG